MGLCAKTGEAVWSIISTSSVSSSEPGLSGDLDGVGRLICWLMGTVSSGGEMEERRPRDSILFVSKRYGASACVTAGDAEKDGVRIARVRRFYTG
jgi:hypothetical protein